MLYYDDVTPGMTCNVPDGYQGRCKVVLDGMVSRSVVLPNVEEAKKVAFMALDLTIGGYGEATIEATDEQATIETAIDWITD